MKKICLLLMLCAWALNSQNNSSWKGYFSYTDIRDLSESPTRFFAASENALFVRNLATNTMKTINTIDGLSGQTITALYHSPTFNRTLVGYENGLIIVINEADGTMLNVVDIINKQLPSNIKRVNHFTEFDGIAYVSCDFGMVEYNLQTLLFGDTFFIGDNGAEIIVSQSTVFNGFIYAATNSGIRRAAVDNPNLNDFSQWSVVVPGVFVGVEAFNSELIAVNSSGQVSRFNGGTFNALLQLSAPPVDLRASGDKLIVATASTVNIYNQTLGLITQIQNFQVPGETPTFTSATVIGQEIFIGTKQIGVISSSLSNPVNFENITPNGPVQNYIWSITTTGNSAYVTYGAYSVDYNPGPLTHLGISKWDGSSWLNIPYPEVHAAGKEAGDLVRSVVNPNNPAELYVASYHDGLLKFENDILVAQYDHNNSGLETLVSQQFPGYISVRIELGGFDRNGNLWMTNAQVDDALKVLRTNGSWQSYNMENILSGAPRFGRMVIDKNNTKWVASYSDGVIAFNESSNTFKKITMGSEQGNLPSSLAWSLAIDNNNQLWIGTYRGLRVLSSVDRYQNENQMTANPIIIIEEDVAQELLYEQFITDIAVDGANNKWIGTADSGVFMLSPNGQETLHRFTTANSPLPSNAINDIDINGETGEVFIATEKGMVSFKGTATEANSNLGKVFVYPNPVRPGYDGTVKISGLTDKANVKITDIEGSLVHEAIAQGGTIEWDTKAFGKYRVASGVYMIFISTEDGNETKVKKVMIVR